MNEVLNAIRHEIRLKAEEHWKLGRSLEKEGDRDGAVSHYSRYYALCDAARIVEKRLTPTN